jgi:hypothetical protein
MPKKKSKGRPGRINDLLKWIKRPFLDKMLDDGESPYKCAMWCTENGFPISSPTMYEYARKRKEAIVNGLVAEIMPAPPSLNRDEDEADEKQEDDSDTQKKPKRTMAEIKKEAADKRRKRGMKKAQQLANMERKAQHMTVNKIKHDMELLDEIIQKGFETLKMMDVINPATAVKAIELKQKITGGAHAGLTTYGIEEIRLREAARENAIVTILLEYIPEEKHPEVLERMEKATLEYYESIGLGDAYRQHNAQMEEAANE